MTATTKRKSPPDISWHPFAACHPRNRPPDVLAEWFAPLTYRPRGRPADEPGVRRALALCGRCPMRARCAEQAVAEGFPAGVWGGRYRRGRFD